MIIFILLQIWLLQFAGDFEPEKILEEIKKRIIKSEKKELPKRIYPNEPEEINEKQKIVDMKLSNPMFAIGFKDKVEGDMVKRHIGIQALLNTLLGKSSKLYKELTDENILLGSLDPEYEFSKEYAFVLITGVSREPEKVTQKINKTIEEAKKNGLNEEDFLRNKKKLYGDYITEYNSASETARMFLSDYFKGVNSFEYLNKYDEVDKEYAEKLLNEIFVDEKEVVSIVK